MREHLSPRDVARIVRVSQSSIKRWCDQGQLAFETTPGGHRRISGHGLLRLLRDQQLELAEPELLGLPPGTGKQRLGLDQAVSPLTAALVEGDEVSCRRVVFEQYLQGQRLSVIGDRLLARAFHQIGEFWERGQTEIYQERRGAEIAIRLLSELRSVLELLPSSAPKALGASPQGDHYALPTALVELVLRDNGWDAQSLGASMPLDGLISAVECQRPRLLWLSVTHVEDESQFVEAYDRLRANADRELSVVLGGRALGSRLRSRLSAAYFCDDLEHLETVAATLFPAAAATLPIAQAC